MFSSQKNSNVQYDIWKWSSKVREDRSVRTLETCIQGRDLSLWEETQSLFETRSVKRIGSRTTMKRMTVTIERFFSTPADIIFRVYSHCAKDEQKRRTFLPAMFVVTQRGKTEIEKLHWLVSFALAFAYVPCEQTMTSEIPQVFV